MSEDRIGSDGLAQLDGKTRRGARKLLQRHHADPSALWRGRHLAVTLVEAIGGAAGWKYEVGVSSLPQELQDRWKAAQRSDEAPSRRLRDDHPVIASWRLHAITPALGLAKHTREFADAIRAIARATRTGPDGRPIIISERTIARWIKAYECDGIAGLIPRVRRDKGVRRFPISAAWSKAIADRLDTAAIEGIERTLRAFVDSLVAAGESPKRTIFRAGMKLRELTEAAGVATADMPKAAFSVPRRFIDGSRPSRKVATRARDAKAWHDLRPAIMRKLALRPTEFDLDAMHFDHIVRRDDGSVAYPKAIIAVCRATHRAFLKVILLEPGEGIRREHVAAFIQELFEAWGVPERITIDNGGEFGAIPDLTDILQLVGKVHSTDGRAPIVHARPYNARAKVVETIIGVLQRCWLSGLPGHVGNNRINRKTHKVGRPTDPFPGSFDLFVEVVQMRVREYNAAPQRGKLKGRSPDEAYRAHVDTGFAIAKVDPASLQLAFSTRHVASVGKFGIKVNGRWWTCPLLHYRSGEKIGILKSRFGEWPKVPLYDLSDEKTIIGYAEPHEAVDGNDPANAREVRKAQRRFNARARDLAKAARPADLIADTIASAPALPPPAMAPIAGTIVPNPDAAEIVAGMVESGDAREQCARDRAEAEKDRRRALMDRLNANAAAVARRSQ